MNLLKLQSWDYIQSQLAKTGRDSLQHLVLHCDVETVSPSSAELADQLLKPLDEESLRTVSTGTAAVYHWVCLLHMSRVVRHLSSCRYCNREIVAPFNFRPFHILRQLTNLTLREFFFSLLLNKNT